MLYASGEESHQQIKLRADRLDVLKDPGDQAPAKDIYLLAESNLENILAAVEEVQPAAIVVDSVQTTVFRGARLGAGKREPGAARRDAIS